MDDPSPCMWDVRVHTRVLRTERLSDLPQTPHFHLQLKISNIVVRLISPDAIYESRPLMTIWQGKVPTESFVSLETAHQLSSHMLSRIEYIHPAAIPLAAPEIASELCFWSQHLMVDESMHLEIGVEIKRCYCYDYQAAAALALARGESMMDDDEDSVLQPAVSRGLFGSSSCDEVKEFLGSCRAQTWDSEKQCAICLECLSGDGEDEKGMKKVASLASCSHLFYAACIRKWVEASNTCPLCRKSVNVVSEFM